MQELKMCLEETNRKIEELQRYIRALAATIETEYRDRRMEVNALMVRAEESFGITKTDILGNNKLHKLVYIRMSIATLLLDKGFVVEEVASVLNRDRTTILYYLKQVQQTYNYDKVLAKIYDALKTTDRMEVS